MPAFNLDVLLAMRKEHRFFVRGGNDGCDVCGAHFRFGDVFEHAPSGERIVVGWECADKIATLDRSVFDHQLGAHRAATLNEARKAQKAAECAAFLAAHEGLADALRGDHYILRDLAGKLAQFGNLSDAQVALAFKLAREIAERASERKVPVAFIDGERAFVRGVIVSTKLEESRFHAGSTWKVTVKVTVPDGGVFLLFGSLPRALEGVERGTVVEFSAMIQHGQRDPSFGFFKRPTNARRAV